MQSKRIVIGAILLCLTMFGTGCATRSIVVKPTKCLHPQVKSKTVKGLTQALMEYHAAVNTCNVMNGYEAEYGSPKKKVNKEAK